MQKRNRLSCRRSESRSLQTSFACICRYQSHYWIAFGFARRSETYDLRLAFFLANNWNKGGFLAAIDLVFPSLQYSNSTFSKVVVANRPLPAGTCFSPLSKRLSDQGGFVSQRKMTINLGLLLQLDESHLSDCPLPFPQRLSTPLVSQARSPGCPLPGMMVGYVHGEPGDQVNAVDG